MPITNIKSYIDRKKQYTKKLSTKGVSITSAIEKDEEYAKRVFYSFFNREPNSEDNVRLFRNIYNFCSANKKNILQKFKLDIEWIYFKDNFIYFQWKDVTTLDSNNNAEYLFQLKVEYTPNEEDVVFVNKYIDILNKQIENV